jgi:hypothetical protein
MIILIILNNPFCRHDLFRLYQITTFCRNDLFRLYQITTFCRNDLIWLYQITTFVGMIYFGYIK